MDSKVSQNMELNDQLDISKKIDDDYKNSREHKSIKKAMTINAMYVLLMIVNTTLLYIFRNQQKPNAMVYLANAALIKLSRTFSTILTSIYCFDLVYGLFKQILSNMRDYLEYIYNQISGRIGRVL